jgi:hypothetical protein
MGDKTMFDLSLSMNAWREQLRQGGRCRQEDIDELEEHLREEMTKLERIGLSDEEAFLLAARRLGGVDALREEFEKVNSSSVWLNRLRWMAVGVLMYLGVSTASAAFGKLLMIGAVVTGLHPYAVATISPLASIGIMAILAVVAIKILASQRIPGLGGKPCTPMVQGGFILGVLLWFTLLPMFSTLAIVFVCRYVTPDVIGRYSMATTWGTFALSVFVPLAIVGWLMTTTKKVTAS